jgi:acyl-CoA synthetase (AMP-forming)/AMP-acid ligase II
MLHAQVRIVDEQANPVAPNVIGEIICRSPAGVTAYYQNPAKTAETFRNGWIHTGDLGSMDEEGYVVLRGRKKDMIITGGQNVFASEVEESILACEGVADCAVIGLPDPVWGERVSAVVVTRAGAVAAPDVIASHCREKLAGFKVPRQFILQQEPLPRTPTGKVQKFILVEKYKD